MTRSGSVSSGYKYLEDLCIHLVTNPLPTPSFTISAKFRDMERVVASSNRTCGFARIGFRHRSEVSQSRTSPRFLRWVASVVPLGTRQGRWLRLRRCLITRFSTCQLIFRVAAPQCHFHGPFHPRRMTVDVSYEFGPRYVLPLECDG